MSEGSYDPSKEGWREYQSDTNADYMVYVNEYGIIELTIEVFERLMEKIGCERTV